jgi:hypothetical protein
MFGSAIIEVVIGLIFVYFVLAAIASHIDEFVAGSFGWRAQDLETGTQALLGDPELHHRVWNHPIVKGLRDSSGGGPSYLPASAFSLALFDTLAPNREAPLDLKRVREPVKALPDAPRHALLSIIDTSSDMPSARAGVEAWYNAGMDRVSGVYKRRIQRVTLGVSAALTLVLGVDTIAIASTLWQEQGVRTALTGAASAASGNGLEDALNTLSQVGLPLGWIVLPQTFFGWFLKVVGLLVTIFAVSLGAPTWFDLLKRFSNPRAAGPKPNGTQSSAL